MVMKPGSKRFIILIMTICAIVAQPSFAQDATAFADDELSSFIAGSRAKYQLHDEIGLEPTFYDAAVEGGTANEIVERFAAALGVSNADAGQYITTMFAVRTYLRECNTASQSLYGPFDEMPPICQTSSHSELAQQIRDVGLAEPTGGLLLSLGMNLYEHPLGEFVREVALEHDQRATILAALSDFTGDFTYIAWALAQPETELAVFQAALRDRFEHAPSELIASLLVAYWRSDSLPTTSHAGATAALIRQFLEYGMIEPALAFFDGLPAVERAMITSADSEVFATSRGLAGRCIVFTSGGCSYSRGDASAQSVFFDFAVSMSAALMVVDRRAEAAELVAAVQALGEPEDVRGMRLLGLVDEIVQPKLADDEVFDAFVLGHPRDLPAPSWMQDLLRARPGSRLMSGWLGEAQSGSPALKLAVTEYLRARGRDDMAEYVFSSPLVGFYSFRDSPRRFSDALVAQLGVEYSEARRRALGGLTAANVEYGARRGIIPSAEERSERVQRALESNLVDLTDVQRLPSADEIEWLFDDPLSDAVVVIDVFGYGASAELFERKDGGVERTRLGGWVN